MVFADFHTEILKTTGIIEIFMKMMPQKIQIIRQWYYTGEDFLMHGNPSLLPGNGSYW